MYLPQLLVRFLVLYSKSKLLGCVGPRNSWWAGHVLQSTAWASCLPLSSQPEVESQATFGFLCEQRGGDVQAILKTEW